MRRSKMFSVILFQKDMSYRDLCNGPDQVPPDLLESSDDEDGDEPSLVTENTEGMKWGFIETGYYHYY